MKKRYILPIIYICLEGLSLVIPGLFNIVFFFSMPAMLIINPLVVLIGEPIDTTYLVILATIIQFFLIGCLWDYVAEKFGSVEYKSK